ncbi:hypothetical protein A1Q2_04588 [Trichosporon asahii var. asahii CBS 8904]|uniref:Uncharacterized protein n=1 Tax=Trichosporon asahii var. asahii (strain CBS 8904) TaxID=1220162 RepID=K1VAP1_TRIAC|nr:hypothetical protein A1Q2_04588 [Trichosporon asahii var. asahii CBS 8904]
MAKYLTAPVARKAGAHNHAVRRATRTRACSPRASVRAYRRCSSNSSAKQLAIGRVDPRPTRIVVSDDSDSDDDEEDHVVYYSDFDGESD